MPHKHKRKAENDDSQYDLPPTIRAAPLPVGKNAPKTASGPRSNKKRKVANIEGYGQDDTPKEFARLMAFSKTGGKRRSSGLDDGTNSSKKQKLEAKQTQKHNQNDSPKTPQQPTAENAANNNNNNNNTAPSSESQSHPTLLPGESLSSFSTRVNQALPLTGISRRGASNSNSSGGRHLPDHRITKHERKLKRLQAGWRDEEARLRDKEQEARELAEEEDDEMRALWEDKTEDLSGQGEGKKKKGKKKKKQKRRRLVVGEVRDDVGVAGKGGGRDGGDAWDREMARRKAEEKKRWGGLHDVVSAPPRFTRVPREIFKEKKSKGGSGGSSRSLREQEELEAQRRGVIEGYRRMVKGKRGGGDGVSSVT